MAVGDILQVTFLCRFGDQVGLNVRHYRVSAQTLNPPTFQATADALSTIFGPLYRDCLSDKAVYGLTRVQKIRPTPPTLPIESAIGFGAGNRPGDPLPKQVSGLISLRTMFAGRAFRGRAYIPFPDEQANDATAVPTPGYIIAITALGSAMIMSRTVVEGANSWTLDPIIFNRVSGGFTVLLAHQERTVWATQRRRGSFGASNPVGDT